MISDYSGAVRASFLDALQLLVRLALPLAILAGLGAIALAAAYFRDPEAWRSNADVRRANATRLISGIAVGLLAYVGYSLLQKLLPVAQAQIEWAESAEATSKPKIDAQPVGQSGPAVAALKEKTYTRRLTLPPELVGRIGSEGIGVLAPYLQDPSTENVLKLVDEFKQSGQDVVFTREVTRLEEDPLPLSKSQVVAEVKGIDDRAFDLNFSATYEFKNPKSEPIDARFQFPVPQVGTMRELKVEIDGERLPDPDPRGLVEWSGKMEPGQTKTAKVAYQVVAGEGWEYHMGSFRRRVEQFNLKVLHDGIVRFPRYAMKPTRQSGSELDWELSNVITDERIAVSFPPNRLPEQTYLQALGAMPVALAIFLIGALLMSLVVGTALGPQRLLLGLAALCTGFAASHVVANYLGYAAGILITPILGGIGAGWLTKPAGWVPAVVAAAIPAAFLSGEHTGLLLIVYAVLAAIAVRRDLAKT